MAATSAQVSDAELVDAGHLTPVEQLMKGPLVSWVRTFRQAEEEEDIRGGSLDYTRLVDGAFLGSILSRIDPRSTNGSRAQQIQPAEDVYGRIRNFDALVRAVKTFYEDVLGQLILVRLPDPVSLGRDPGCETSLAGMQRLLLLVLGCAVQGPSKEDVIEDIKKLPLATQHSIVECIQQVADNPACVWNKEWSEWPEEEEVEDGGNEDESGSSRLRQQQELYRILVQHLRRLVHERDDYAQQVTALVLRELSSNSQRNSHQQQHHNNNETGNSGGSTGVVVELAEAKAKIRRCRQELEEKCEQVAELKDELETLQGQAARVKQENMDLVQEARLSKALRDELDIVRERASKVDRLEAELNRYKDKLNDIDYYKARLEELREDNRLLEETKVILEGQLDSARQRAELVLDLEAELLGCKSQLAGVLAEKEAQSERLEKLADENAHWQLCTKNCLSESASLTAELESLRAHQATASSSGINKDLGEQMSSMDLLNKARRLEMENQRLAALLSSSSAKESGLRGDSGEKIVQLEGECARLRLRLADMEEERRTKDGQAAEKVEAAASRVAIADKERQELQRVNLEQKNAIENLKVDRCKMDELEIQVAALNGENQKLQRSIELVQRRAESVASETRDLESENSKLHKTAEGLRHSLRRLNDLEKENTDLEADNHRLDRESKGLHKEIARLKQAIEVKDESLDEYSVKLSTAERELKRLQKEVELLQTQGSRVRELERDNKELQQASVVEHKTLAAIREELVQEKIRCQQLHTQLDTNSRTLEASRIEIANLKNAHEELIVAQKTSSQKSASLAESSSTGAHPAGGKTGNNRGDSLPPSLELGREVLAVKDRLVELERQNAVLLAEKDNLTAQVLSQKERVNESGAQLAALSQQLATLQVENSTLASQLSSVTSQSATLQSALTSNESEREKLTARLQSSEARLERVSRDQQDLQKLHEQLQRDYDSLLAEREQLKTCQRESKSELRALQEQLTTGIQAEKEWQGKRTELMEELEKARTENRSLGNLRAEHSRLKDDFRSLFVANEKLKSEYKSIQGDYKGLRGDHNSLKLKHTQLQGEAQESRHQMTNLDVEVGKLTNKVSVLQQWNTTLEEDKRNLVNQVSVLLAQYHELLSQTLEEKDHFHEETKNFADKLNHLKRQKEILEDKIMEQYRRMENSPVGSGGGSPLYRKNAGSKSGSGLGALFVKKMRRASSELISRVPTRSRSRNRVGDSLSSPELQDTLQADNYSLESGSQHSGGSNSGSGSLDGGESSPVGGDVTPRGVTGSSNNHLIRQSMPSVHISTSPSGGPFPERISPVRINNSFSSEGTLVPSNRSPLNLNGNPSSPVTNGKSHDPSAGMPDQVNSATSTQTASNNILNSSLGLQSAAPYMMMSPLVMSSSPSLKPIQPLPRTILPLNNNNNNNRNSPTSSLAHFSPSSRSLALLERAGSRTPVCIPETALDQPILEDPADSASTDVIPTDLSLGDPTSGGNKLFPHLTSTTRINVNISTANVTPLERRGSVRLDRPSRLLLPDDFAGSSSPPLLPARSNAQERPALPPRPGTASTVTEEVAVTPAENGNDTSAPANSIWYEYGCV